RAPASNPHRATTSTSSRSSKAAGASKRASAGAAVASRNSRTSAATIAEATAPAVVRHAATRAAVPVGATKPTARPATGWMNKGRASAALVLSEAVLSEAETQPAPDGERRAEVHRSALVAGDDFLVEQILD